MGEITGHGQAEEEIKATMNQPIKRPIPGKFAGLWLHVKHDGKFQLIDRSDNIICDDQRLVACWAFSATCARRKQREALHDATFEARKELQAIKADADAWLEIILGIIYLTPPEEYGIVVV